MSTKQVLLQEKPEARTALDHARMHADHLQFFSENSFWRDDVAAWQHEMRDALARLEFVREALKKHDEKLCQHAASIRLNEQLQAEHEHALALYERGERGQELVEMAAAHQNELRKHDQQREQHEQMKRRHHELLARFRMFVLSLESTLAE